MKTFSLDYTSLSLGIKAMRLTVLATGLLISQFALGVVSVRSVEARSTWQAEWEKTVACAKKEGKLVVHVSGYLTTIEIFQKKYPEIKLTTVTGRGSTLGPRIMAERRAGKYLGDIYSGGPNTMFEVLYRNKALDPIKPALILPEVVDKSKWWGEKHRYLDPEGKHIFVLVGNTSGAAVAYNTKLVNAGDFRSYWDFLNPKWKRKIVARDVRLAGPGTPAARFFYYQPDLGPKFIRRLFSEMDITVTRDRRQGTDWLASGKFAMCFFCGGIARAKRQGLPVTSFKLVGMKEGVGLSASFGTLGLLNNAPHPNAAKVFINWFLSREGQSALQKAEAENTGPDSLRIDIPKDDVPPHTRRLEGVKYIEVDTPDRIDMSPIRKVVTGALAGAKKR